jgi:translation elongation factor EF-Ts
MPNVIHNMRVTLRNMSNLGFMNCQTKVAILDLNGDFQKIKKIIITKQSY